MFATYDEYMAFLKGFEIDFERMKQKGWKSWLGKEMGGEYEVLTPRMPNSMNAKYGEWKIWLEKLIPYFESEVALIGHSLGGIFLAKYLSENDFPKKILGTILTAAPYDEKDRNAGYVLVDFALSGSLDKFTSQGGKIFLYHSEDDPIVPIADLKKYQKALPDAIVRTFKDREHFGQDTFPEIVEDIRSLF